MFGRLRRAGAEPVLPKAELPGLATGLGGLGLSLKDLVQLYGSLASFGNAVALHDGVFGKAPTPVREAVLSPQAAWQVIDILGAMPTPVGSQAAPIAYKTGTSYGYRDAWTIGFDGRHVIGVWVGRPDNGSVPGITGGGTAAPILFEAYNRSGVNHVALPGPPKGIQRLTRNQLPKSLQRYSGHAGSLVAVNARTSAPEIVFPPDGARVERVRDANGLAMPVVLKLNGGKAPYRWLANGMPLPDISRRRTQNWVPDGAGFSELTVIDAEGRASTVKLYIQ
jgi:penicillin-binding protein 1C